MKIFISWSGEKSRKVANYLKTWIEQIIQVSEPWISVDIDKGKKWNQEILSELELSKVGIICITRDNLDAPWILFEAGALSKTKDSFVCTFLLDVNPTDLAGPLSIFQATKFNEDDIYKLLLTINNQVHKNGIKGLKPEILKDLFKTFYPKLEENIKRILDSENADEEVIRSDRELIEEAVQILRKLEIPELKSYVNLNEEGVQLLDFYATKFAKFKSLGDKYQAGTDNNIEEFMSYIRDNPFLLKAWNGETNLKAHIKGFYDGLPF